MPVAGFDPDGRQARRDLAEPARPHVLREIPEVYGRALIGWETLPERLLRQDRDLTLADVLRIQHLLGQKPHEAGVARRQMVVRESRGVDQAQPGRHPDARRRRRTGPGQ